MAKTDKIPKIDPVEIELLIQDMKKSDMSERSKEVIGSLLQTLLYLALKLGEKRASITRLREMIFGRKSEKQTTSPPSNESDRQLEPQAETPSENKLSTEKPGHGRKGPEAYEGRHYVLCSHKDLKSGEQCPDQNCGGQIYKCGRPHVFIQFTGTPMIQATEYEQEVLRCSLCGCEYEAPLPEGVTPQRWDETADAAIAINKYLTAVPFSRSSRVQESAGVPIAESVQFERCEVVANALLPIYKELVNEASNAEVLHGDDTPVKIRELMKENEQRSKKERKGMQTTGLVARRSDGIEIVLYMNGRNHCGENIKEILKNRDKALPPIIRMGDALSLNWSDEEECIICKCLEHARRKFVECKSGYPDESGYVLLRIGQIYINESATSEMTKEERQKYHQMHSEPIMKELLDWMKNQLSKKKVEPNSSIGKAIKYFEKNYDHLCGFIKTEGAPIDNNACERNLRAAVLIRKNSYYYQTSYGAAISGIILSVLMSCVANKTNVWKYLVKVLKESGDVRHHPRRYLLWTYDESVNAEAKEVAV